MGKKEKGEKISYVKGDTQPNKKIRRYREGNNEQEELEQTEIQKLEQVHN